MTKYPNLTIIILAGGKSSRMGQDKGLMDLNGKAMIEHVIDVAKKITTQIIIVSNNKNYEKFGLKVYQDIFPEKGPLGGIYTGLINSTTEKNLILSCDIPHVKKELLEFILLESGENEITVALHENKIHPLIGAYSKSCEPIILGHILTNQLKVSYILNSLKTKQIDVSHFDSSNFRNINSESDL